jgi:hypothetical protein
MITGKANRFLINHRVDEFQGRLGLITDTHAVAPVDGTWYFIVVNFDATADETTIYVDNASDGATSGAPSLINTNISISGDGDWAWTGFWNKQLDATERAALYAEGETMIYADIP